MIPFAASFLASDPAIGRWRGGLVVDLARLDGSDRAHRVAREAESVEYGLVVAADGTFRLFRGADARTSGRWVRKGSAIVFRYPDPVNPKAVAEQVFRIVEGRLVHRPDPKRRPAARIEFRRVGPRPPTTR